MKKTAQKLVAMLSVFALLLVAFPVSAFAATEASVLDSKVEAISAAPRAATYYKTNCVCNLRANAGTSYKSLGLLSAGQTVVYHSSKTNGGYTWYYVSVVGGTYSGYYGYIRSDLLNYYYWG